MTDENLAETKMLFTCLNSLYKQSQLLVLDADRIMEEYKWHPQSTTAIWGLSYLLNSPERWYPRWIARFYYPSGQWDSETHIFQMPFISVHFTSDHDTEVNDPLVCAGWILYDEPKLVSKAEWEWWMCKYWFYGKPNDQIKGWHTTGISKQKDYIRGTETFSVPLYDITSSPSLQEKVIDVLMSRDANSR